MHAWELISALTLLNQWHLQGWLCVWTDKLTSKHTHCKGLAFDWAARNAIVTRQEREVLPQWEQSPGVWVGVRRKKKKKKGVKKRCSNRTALVCYCKICCSCWWVETERDGDSSNIKNWRYFIVWDSNVCFTFVSLLIEKIQIQHLTYILCFTSARLIALQSDSLAFVICFNFSSLEIWVKSNVGLCM